jgi:hypothetical protein
VTGYFLGICSQTELTGHIVTGTCPRRDPYGTPSPFVTLNGGSAEPGMAADLGF